MPKQSNPQKDPLGHLTKEKSGKPKLLITGLGASAGGIQALREFFKNVPADSGIAYVVILHLSPDHDSYLAEVLQQVASIPVIEVKEKVQVEANHVYVISPTLHLLMQDGFLAVSPNMSIEDRRAPVDIFFRTLAESHGSHAVCAVLSGTGANGSMGLKRVKERGGVVFVQNPREAEFDEMPRNSIATELVDEVVLVAELPQKIIAYYAGLQTLRLPVRLEEQDDDHHHNLREVLLQLRLRTGHDFTNYKRPTLLRRIERRINVRTLTSLSAYVAFLKENPEEVTALLKDLLISVTNFFRDKKAFEMIEQEIIPRILSGKTAEHQVRIWVAACATGEEAYSLAMLCAEKVLDVLDAPKIQIFATDIDEAAIAHAREGLYTLNDAADVSPERLRRFFIEEGHVYRVRREIREMVLFADHNFIKDPPFSQLDLVSCRNVMIYLNQVAQERVTSTFHFALRPGGYLFLGTSESIDPASDLYTVFNREQHIYQSQQVSMRAYPVPDYVPNFRIMSGHTAVAPGQEKKGVARITFSELHQRLLEEYAPPSLVVNHEYEIVHLSSKAGKYLQIAGGEPSQNLLKLVKEELRLELRSALYQAVQQQVPVEARGLKVSLNGRSETINLHVRPVLERDTTTRGFLLVLFEPAVDKGESKEVVRTSDQPIAQQLEEELMLLKTQLRSTNEQHKFQAEELKASNEEFQAMNEELRSATEELETSKEELQSINEELRTVNQELKVKIEETSLSSNNLMNLINSADVATIFLDRGLRVNLFTPVARQIFNLIAADFGRPLTDITNKLVYTEVLQDTEAVLQNLLPIEKEVQTIGGQTYLMRIMPYRTSDDRINGVVLSFFDITERKATEQQLRQSEEKYLQQLEQEVEERTAELKSSREQYSSLVENTPDVITRWNKDLKLTFANSAFIDKAGVQLEQLYDKTFTQMGQSEEIAVPYMQSLRKAFDTRKPVEHFNAFPTPHGEVQFFSRMVPEKNDQGAVQTVLAIARDITALKNAEQELLNLKDEIAQNATDKYLTLFNSIDEGFTILESIQNQEGKISDMIFREVNASFERQTGLSEVVDKKISELLPNSTPYWLDLYNQVTETGQPAHEENYVQDVGRWYDINCLQLGGQNSPFIALMINDITQRKRQDQHQALLSEISKDLVAPSDIAETMKRMCEKIGRYFDAKWCLFIENREEPDQSIRYEWQANDTSLLEGIYKATEYLSVEHGEAIRAGALCTIADTHKIPGLSAVKYGALGIRSLAIVPLVIADQLNFQLMIVCDVPQQWREDESSLLQEIMSRVWMRLERAKSEERIRESEAKAHTVAQLVPVLLWQTDASGDTITLNQRWLEYTGQSLEESQGSGWTTAIHPEDQPYAVKIFATALKTQTEVELQYRIRSQEGEYRWFMVKQVPVKDENGKVTEWFGAAFDIHERKMADENLHSMAERLQLALEAGELGSYEYDFVTGEHLTTPQYRANFGFAEDEPYTFEELQARILPLDRAAMDLELAQAIANHTISTAEYRVQLPNGKIRWIKSMGRILYDANDKPLKMAGITLDITDEKGFTEELSRQVAERTLELQRSNEDLRQFAHVASHDLKEPVRKIKTFNNRVLDEFAGQLPAQVVAYLHKIGIASNRMTSMIDGVLHYSKLGSDSQSITDVDLNEIIQQIETDLEVLIEEKGAVLTHLNLPVLKAANVLIYQLFYNLILNALKFSRAGVTPQITISWEMAKIIEKDFFKIIVADNGIGFEPEFEQLIFKTFTRLHSIDQYDGTGLGLALCKKIIEQHHGFISAIGRPGEGASFTLLFPNHNTFYEN